MTRRRSEAWTSAVVLSLALAACADHGWAVRPPAASTGGTNRGAPRVAAGSPGQAGASPTGDGSEPEPPSAGVGIRDAEPARRACDDAAVASSTDICDDDVMCGYRGYCCPSQRCLRSAEPRPAELPTPTRVSARGPSAGVEGIGAWIAERRAEARRGVRRYVRIPLATASDGWGCVCPSRYVGDSPSYAHDDSWITPENAMSAARAPSAPTPPTAAARSSANADETEEPYEGEVVIVDGYFTGAVSREDLRGRDDPPEWLYHPSVFRITREHGPLDEDDAEAARVAFLGDPIQCEVRVHDPTSPLNVRERPNLQAPIVGTLADWTLLEVTAVRGRWSRISAPVAGWIWGERTITVCASR